MHFDVSSIKARSFGGAKLWLLVVDETTGHAFSFFVKKKSEVPGKIVGLIEDLKAKHGMEVKVLRCDNAGENFKTEELCVKEGLGIVFECTAPDTP